MVDYGIMNVLRMRNPLTTEEGIRLDIFALGILILDMLGIPMGKQNIKPFFTKINREYCFICFCSLLYSDLKCLVYFKHA